MAAAAQPETVKPAALAYAATCSSGKSLHASAAAASPGREVKLKSSRSAAGATW